MAANRSTMRWVGARVPWASSTAWMMRASKVSLAAAVTRNSNSPVSLIVPANSGSPGAFSTGILSPVTDAWLTALWPLLMVPSSAIRSPGRTRTVACRGTVVALVEAQVPSACCMSTVSGVSATRPWMALRARSTARASISSAMAYSAITIAASGHWPITKAPVTATVISALMLSLPRSRADKPFL